MYFKLFIILAVSGMVLLLLLGAAVMAGEEAAPTITLDEEGELVSANSPTALSSLD